MQQTLCTIAIFKTLENSFEILVYVWKKLECEKYLKLARETFDTAHSAWIKYGFHEKAENFKKKYGADFESDLKKLASTILY